MLLIKIHVFYVKYLQYYIRKDQESTFLSTGMLFIDIYLELNLSYTLGSNHLIFMGGGGRKTSQKKFPALISGKKKIVWPEGPAKKILRLA